MIKFKAYKMLLSAEGPMALDVSFTVAKGSIMTLFGNSGAGKTTILRILAGLTNATNTLIEVEGKYWDNSEKKIVIPARKRPVGFVFQDFALFPNLNVKENLEFARQKNDNKKIVDELLEIMELEALSKSRVLNLSGGQKQRVALARAIVRKPEVLLLDEPLSSLDDEMRATLQEYILKAHRHFSLTTILVSHYIPEIFKLSDKVVVINKGLIIKEGNPEEVFSEARLSNKFKVTGEILEIKKSDVIYVLSILSGNNILKVVATKDEIKNLKLGQKVLIASKAFNPIIQPLE